MANFRPSYHDQKESYQQAQDATAVANTMRSILLPLQALGQAQEVAVTQQRMQSQALSLAEATKAAQDRMSADAAYQDESNKLGLGQAGESAAARKARVAAMVDHKATKHDDDNWLIDQTVRASQREIDAKAFAVSGLTREEWANPERQARAKYDFQMKPLREAGLSDEQLHALPVGSGKVAGDLLADPLNWSSSGVLLGGVRDRIFAAAKPALDKQKADLVVATDKAQIENREDVQNKPEARALREKSDQQALYLAARKQAVAEISADKTTLVPLTSPEGKALVDAKASEILRKLGGAAPAKEAATPSFTKMTKEQFDAIPKGTKFIYNGKTLVK